MTTDEISGKPRVPVEELEELAERYRRIHNANDRSTGHSSGYKDAMGHVADELEALIERYDYE